MRRIGGAAALALGLLAGACGPPPVDPYCSEWNDPSGRAVALCRDLHAHPVCDRPGQTARFERDAAGVARLVGGDPAFCDEARQVVCADRTILPRCLREPD